MLELSNDYSIACDQLRQAITESSWGDELSGTGYGFLGAQRSPQAAAAVEHHLPVKSIELTPTGWVWSKAQQDWGRWIQNWQETETDYQVYVPFVNRADLLIQALDSLLDHAQNVAVIDQSKEGAPTHLIFEHGAALFKAKERIQFTSMMNWAQMEASRRGKRFNVFMHTDAVAVDDALTKVLDKARGIDRLGVMFTNYDALAVFGVEACTDVGFWDETFKWYASDNDYYRRLKLRDWKVEDSWIRVEHLEQQTAKSDPMIFFEARHRHAHAHYIAKWGGSFENDSGDREKFVVPYDGKSCSLLLSLTSPFEVV